MGWIFNRGKARERRRKKKKTERRGSLQGCLIIKERESVKG